MACDGALLIGAREAVARASDLAFVEVQPWRVMADGEDPISGGIPGAVRAGVRSDFAGTPTATSGHLPLPDPGLLRAGMRERGIGLHEDVVVHTRRIEEFSSATRAWFTLLWAGFTSVRVLEGGLPAWVAAGGPLAATRTDPLPAAGSPGLGTPGDTAVEGSAAVRVLDAQKALEIAAYGTLLDSRPASAYNGLDEDPRSGHVPHALHAPSTELLTSEGLLLSPTDLRRWFLAHRALGGHEVGAYCGGGVASSLLVFAGALLGQRIGLYVDSWSAWERDEALPVEQGVPLTRSEYIDTDCT